MSFIRINNGNIEYTGIQLHPKVDYLSSSATQEITGDAFVAPIRSKSNKALTQTVVNSLTNIITNKSSSVLTEGDVQGLLDNVNITNKTNKFTKKINIYRFDQSNVFDSNQLIKNNVINVLMPYHEHRYHNCNYSYSNYHTLNFVNNDNFTTGSALLYANNNDEYRLGQKFSLNFWVNPRYSEPEYTPGTIFHLSSSIAVSLVPGTSKNERNEIDKFKILLQLSSSADIPPNLIDINNITQDRVFTSSNYLSKNNWHHVSVQWGGKFYQNYTGSLFVDDTETKFHAGNQVTLGNKDVPALVIGNFYKGNYLNLQQLVSRDLFQSEGITSLGSISGNPVITADNFSFPFQGEIHEIKLFNKILSDTIASGEEYSERELVKNRGLTSLDNCKLYIPPFFNPNVNSRFIPVSTVERDEKSSDSPFNKSFSFRLGAHLLNLENFVSDFINDTKPRLVNLKESIGTDISISGDEFIYSNPVLTNRNLSILPNDNGLFSPRYDIYSLKSIADSEQRFNTPGTSNSVLPDYSIINLEGIVNNSFNTGWNSPQDILSTDQTLDDNNEGDLNTITNFLGPNPFVRSREVLEPYMWIPQHTREESSAEFVCYNISDIYYGNRINPGTFEIYDNNLTGSLGKIQMRLKDNGLGSLYRADCLTPQATWNNVGNIFYHEGIVFIKSPHLHHFCKDRSEIKFEGDQNLHTMIINIPAYKDYFNSSSNPTYVEVTPSENANDVNKSSVYVTTVNIHDNNFNIIMKANFAQPILKTDEDEFVIRLKEDF